MESQWQAKLTAITDLDNRLVALKSAANDYDERSELLARSATSSKEEVATITNTSTAATGVYSLAVGKNIQERIGSRTYNSTLGIGATHEVNKDGHPVYDTGLVILNGNDYTTESDYHEIDLETGYPVDSSGNVIANIDNYIETDPDNFYYPPLTIKMGDKEMVLAYKKDAAPGEVGFYSGDLTMEELVETINATAQSDPDNMPKIKAEVIFDKNRDVNGTKVDFQRLVINGLEGGQKNHIHISDPTDLSLDKTFIDEPGTSSWFGSSKVKINVSGEYTGSVNKTITVVATKCKDGGVIGQNDIEISWADTQGNKGNFKLRADHWAHDNNSLKEDVELTQGVKINFSAPTGSVVIQNEAFTIDCQNPVMQKAADIGLAQTDKWVHQGVPDLTSPVQSGSGGVFAYSYAGKEYSVAVNAGLGLQGLVDKINNDSNNPGIIASVLNDGMGTATSYKLVLTGHKAGAENSIKILDTTKINNIDFGADTFSHAREASNSMCRIDGYPDDGISWIQRPNNEIGDVLDGVVMTLQGVGETQITIQNNVTEMANRIKSIVEAINYAKTYIKDQTKFTGAKVVSKWNEQTQMFERTTSEGEDASGNRSSEASGIMIGNYGFQISQSTIDNLMTKPIFTYEDYIKALDPDGEKQALYPVEVEDEERDGPSQKGIYKEYLDKHGLLYTSLHQIGIESDPNNKGLYTVKESTLTEALSKNPEAVIKLFTFTPHDDDGISLKPVYEDEDDRYRIGGFNIMMGYTMGDLTRSNDVIDSTTGEVTQSAKGIMKVLAQNYANIMSGIDEKIDRETRRRSMFRQRQEDKFARLETLLASLNDQSTKIQSQIDKLNES